MLATLHSRQKFHRTLRRVGPVSGASSHDAQYFSTGVSGTKLGDLSVSRDFCPVYGLTAPVFSPAVPSAVHSVDGLVRGPVLARKHSLHPSFLVGTKTILGKGWPPVRRGESAAAHRVFQCRLACDSVPAGCGGHRPRPMQQRVGVEIAPSVYRASHRSRASRSAVQTRPHASVLYWYGAREEVTRPHGAGRRSKIESKLHQTPMDDRSWWFHAHTSLDRAHTYFRIRNGTLERDRLVSTRRTVPVGPDSWARCAGGDRGGGGLVQQGGVGESWWSHAHRACHTGNSCGAMVQHNAV